MRVVVYNYLDDSSKVYEGDAAEVEDALRSRYSHVLRNVREGDIFDALVEISRISYLEALLEG